MRTIVAAALLLALATPAFAGNADSVPLPFTPSQQERVDKGQPAGPAAPTPATPATPTTPDTPATPATPPANPAPAAPPTPDATPSPDSTPAPDAGSPATPPPADAPMPPPRPDTPATPANPASPTPSPSPSPTPTPAPTPAPAPAPSPTTASSPTSLMSTFTGGVASAFQSVTGICVTSSEQCAVKQLQKSAAGATTDNNGQNRLAAIAKALSSDDACWACKLYETVFTGMRKLVDQSYTYFVSSKSGLMALVTTILSLAVLVRIAPIVLGTDDGRAAAGIKIFFFRILVVFTLFLGSASTSATGSFVSDWFVDGPLAIGTTLGSTLAETISKTLSQQSGGTSIPNPFGTDLGTGGGDGSIQLNPSDGKTGLTDVSQIVDSSTGTSVTGLQDSYEQSKPGTASLGGADQNTNPVPSSGTSVDLQSAHVAAAKSMLMALHKMGVVGIITGIWSATEGPVQQSSNVVSFIVMLVAGISLAFMFFMFTITFGLRYIDALIRSMLIFSLMPIFAFLWIFDSTRQMAHKALKAGISLAAVFAVSGVVYTVALLIMQVGFQKAFSNPGGGTSTSSLQGYLNQIQGGGFGFLTGAAGTGSGTLNWLGFLILVGSCSLAIACAKLAFELASQMFAFGRADLGIGREVEGEVHNIAGQAKSAGMSFVGGRR